MKIVEGLLYSNDHEWIKVEGKEAYIGITDFAQHKLGEIVYVELPQVDDELNAGDVFSVVESVKAASDSYLPVSGRVVEVNEDLDGEPGLINEDPYANWIVKIELTDESELEELMNAEEYEDFCSKEE
ncbi:glycine cleavage system H protein [Proteiniborus ethanoligenes]|uniref:Glycine cleavage system H protein n=1 Tax=Proteiniborus ethanoligenes TaxID=415015 RepID=A0A1H3MYP3_9FIRM|nr:glycine cleavage system protein GcvH [Proteiniborus ethanoligenes]TAH64002.1 MAG: glycine cleavage system protein GcvH [Gottschalkiaceae bacterium]SDY81696.1 glycine cleavage system H protein [Proteiniborus ethanoligenes]